VWVGPYVTFEPSLAFVAQDDDGVGGYVLGALDSRALEQRQERDWWPALRESYPEQDEAQYRSAMERFAVHDIHDPWRATDELARRFPSHLHIDVVPRLQGRGLGRQLIATLTGSLRAGGSRGVHLVVAPGNHRAIGFYRHLGFTEFPHPFALILTLDLTSAGP
jgi:ribosomal protein S18 acetylase RimI-like enzyme